MIVSPDWRNRRMILKQAVDGTLEPEKQVQFWQTLLTHHTERMQGLEHDPNGYRYHEQEAEKARIMIERLKSKSA